MTTYEPDLINDVAKFVTNIRLKTNQLVINDKQQELNALKEHLEKLKIKLLLLISETTDSSILITGSVDSEYLEKVCGLLSNECKDIKNLSFDYGKNIVMSAEAIKKLLTSTSVILVEQNQKSSLDIIEQEIEAVKEMKKDIIGYIII